MDVCGTEPLVAQVSDSIDCSSSSCPTSATSDDSVPEGYLILTFNRKKTAVIKTAVFADVSDPSLADDFEDESCMDEDEYGSQSEWSQKQQFCENLKATKDPSYSTHEDSGGDDEDKSLTINSNFESCYGEALWVGEDEMSTSSSNRDKDKQNLLADVRDTKPSENQNTPVSNNNNSSQISSMVMMMKDHSWRAPFKISNGYSHRRVSLPIRLARRFSDGYEPRSLKHNFSRHCLIGVHQAGGISDDQSRKMLRCEECGKYYRNEYSLHHHICLKRKDVWKKGDIPSEMVDGQLIYFCPTCNKPFKWLGNLTRHFYVHTGQRFFRCDICSKEFFSAYQVKRHMNSHTGMRFKCEFCEKPFTCKYACAWHTRQHYNSIE